MSREVGLDDAYREACLALGESVVMQRLQAAEMHRLSAERDENVGHPVSAAQPDSP